MDAVQIIRKLDDGNQGLSTAPRPKKEWAARSAIVLICMGCGGHRLVPCRLRCGEGCIVHRETLLQAALRLLCRLCWRLCLGASACTAPCLRLCFASLFPPARALPVALLWALPLGHGSACGSLLGALPPASGSRFFAAPFSLGASASHGLCFAVLALGCFLPARASALGASRLCRLGLWSGFAGRQKTLPLPAALPTTKQNMKGPPILRAARRPSFSRISACAASM